jgi:four helix bundle protein
MDKKSFERLQVYQLAERLADDLWIIIIEWDLFAKDTVGKQLIRAADSIGANIAEGTGKGSFQDNRRFVKIARGSLYETRHWLRRAYNRRLLTEEQVNKLKPVISELSPRLNAYLRSIGNIPERQVSKEAEQGTKDQGPGTRWQIITKKKS